MSYVSGSNRSDTDGEAVAPRGRRDDLTSADIARARAAHMYARKLDGWPTKKIAKLFRMTPQHVNREIRAIPEPARRAIERAVAEGL